MTDITPLLIALDKIARIGERSAGDASALRMAELAREALARHAGENPPSLALEALSAEATQGEWRGGNRCDGGITARVDGEVVTICSDFSTPDAAFASALVNAYREAGALPRNLATLTLVLDRTWQRVVSYPFPQVCKHYVASNMLSDMEALGIEVPKALATAVVEADDETALAFVRPSLAA